MTDFINKVITIVTKEEATTKDKTNTTVKITDQDSIKFVYWKKKKDGTFSSAHEQFKNMQLDEGSVVNVSYVIEAYKGQDGTDRTSNKIIGFRETNEQPVKGQTMPAGNLLLRVQPKHNFSSTGGAIPKLPESRNFEQEAYEKCCSIWAAIEIKNVGHAETLKLIETGVFYQLFQAIKKDGQKRFSPNKTQLVEDPYFNEPDPVYQEEINVDSIPF